MAPMSTVKVERRIRRARITRLLPQDTMSSAYSSASKVDMLKVFLESPVAITGESTSKEMIHILHHLVDCIQSHEVKDKNNFNLLHICLPQGLYNFFVTDLSNQQYPQRAQNPVQLLAYNPAGNTMTWLNKKPSWRYGKMVFKEKKNMDRFIFERFMQLKSDSQKTNF